MSRRYYTLLERAACVRNMLEREQRSATPSSIRILRMKRICQRLLGNLREHTAKRLVGVMSAPSLRPVIVFGSLKARPMASLR